MFTQCAKCETVFRLSAEVLRAAGGQVRCGRCGEVFNALSRLAEDASAFPAGESPLEMEERADEILHSTVPPLSQPAKSAEDSNDSNHHGGVEFARLQVLEKFIEDLSPATPPPAEPPAAAPVNKSKVLNKPAPVTKAPVPAAPPGKGAAGVPASGTPSAGVSARGTRPAEPVKPSSPSSASKAAETAKPKPPVSEPDLDGETSMEFTLPPGELDRIFVDRAPGQRKSVVGPSGAPVDDESHENSEETEAETETEAAGNRVPGLEVSDDVRREMLSGIGGFSAPEFSAPRRRDLPRWAWQGAAAVLAIILVGQLIHGNREWVATHAPLRDALHGLYSTLGVALPAPATLSAYQLRQWGVTGEPTASGTLRVRASILNTAAQLQPYPLLRVTLANRFGSRIGARDFEAAEYMGKPMVRLLAPGERVDATLDIVDPGKDAEGFEIDVCLRGLDQRISCAGDAAAQAKK